MMSWACSWCRSEDIIQNSIRQQSTQPVWSSCVRRTENLLAKYQSFCTDVGDRRDDVGMRDDEWPKSYCCFPSTQFCSRVTQRLLRTVRCQKTAAFILPLAASIITELVRAATRDKRRHAIVAADIRNNFWSFVGLRVTSAAGSLNSLILLT